MTLTREQIQRRQAQTPDGWVYDWRFAVIHSDHTITRRVTLDGNSYIEARMGYRAEHGAQPWQTTGRQIPTMHIARYTWNEARTAAVSRGLGKWIDLGTPQKNKNFKVLCTLADGITDEIIMEHFNADRELITNGRPLFG